MCVFFSSSLVPCVPRFSVVACEEAAWHMAMENEMRRQRWQRRRMICLQLFPCFTSMHEEERANAHKNVVRRIFAHFKFDISAAVAAAVKSRSTWNWLLLVQSIRQMRGGRRQLCDWTRFTIFFPPFFVALFFNCFVYIFVFATAWQAVIVLRTIHTHTHTRGTSLSFLCGCCCRWMHISLSFVIIISHLFVVDDVVSLLLLPYKQTYICVCSFRCSPFMPFGMWRSFKIIAFSSPSPALLARCSALSVLLYINASFAMCSIRHRCTDCVLFIILRSRACDKFAIFFRSTVSPAHRDEPPRAFDASS